MIEMQTRLAGVRAINIVYLNRMNERLPNKVLVTIQTAWYRNLHSQEIRPNWKNSARCNVTEYKCSFRHQLPECHTIRSRYCKTWFTWLHTRPLLFKLQSVFLLNCNSIYCLSFDNILLSMEPYGLRPKKVLN